MNVRATAAGMRPRYHFAAKKGWINDPNGLIYLDGLYHLFFQYYPDDIRHGPMHWGHAVSSDLTTWKEEPIALYPDEHGQCFSGSAIAAKPGVTADSLGDAEVLLYYTAHLPRTGEPDLQTQCVATADRGFSRIHKHPNNPIIANPGLEAFRDPKVSWHEPTRRWIMVVTLGQSIGFYNSPDGLNWTYVSSFGEGHGCHSEGPWECPDLFPMRVDDDGKELWVLVVGIGSGAFAGGSGTQYFVGTFDGERFESLNAPNETLWLDHGSDCYATQSWSGPTPGGPTVISWMSNWAYARATPTAEFRGLMTLPRQLSLNSTGSGPRLFQKLPESVAARFPRTPAKFGRNETEASFDLSLGGVHRCTIELALGAREAVEISLFGEAGPWLTLTRTRDRLVKVEQRRSGTLFDGQKLPGFATDCSFELEAGELVKVDAFLDRGAVEVGLDGGRAWISSLFFPADPAGPLHLRRTLGA